MSEWTNNGKPFDPYKPRGSYKKRPRYFIVRGSGEFPIDMLRYDDAWALTGVGEPDAYDEAPRDVVCATGNQSTVIPTGGRWDSFGWRVTVRSLPRRDVQRLFESLGPVANILKEVS